VSTFAFRAVDLAGLPSRGELDAPDKKHVAEQLRDRGLIVLDVTEKKAATNIEDFFNRFRGVSMRELAVMSRQFATLVASGMPMLRTLTTIEDQTEDDQIKEAVASVRADVEAGSSLAAAMERQPNVFDKLYRAMVRSGEGSGRLEEALDRVAFQIEKLDALRRQVRSAMLYPTFVFAFALIVMVATIAFVVPVFVGIFKEIAAENPGTSSALPLPTQITVNVSSAITHDWFIIIPVLGLIAVGFVQWKKTERGRMQWDKVKLKIPFKVGDVVHKVALARWSRTFSGAIASGVPILQAIQVTGETSGNAVVEAAMEDVYASVKGGGTIAAPIEQSSVFPPMVGHMVSVGEDTGQLEHMLGKIADFYEDEVDAKVKALTSLIEPLMICFVGGIVGFIVISMYLPIFSLYDKIR
jgi:type IV pilus assembly protein PilC